MFNFKIHPRTIVALAILLQIWPSNPNCIIVCVCYDYGHAVVCAPRDSWPLLPHGATSSSGGQCKKRCATLASFHSAVYRERFHPQLTLLQANSERASLYTSFLCVCGWVFGITITKMPGEFHFDSSQVDV